MNKIEHYILPEHSNDLYKHEAISSISLTKDVAEKINELVDAYNNLSSVDLKWKQEQEGRIRKGVLFMKDNLLNSIHDLLNTLIDSGEITEKVGNQIIEGYKKLVGRCDTYISLEEFGALGDGVTDDTKALQSAINFAQLFNKSLVFKSGATYKIKSLLITKHIDIDFNGATIISDSEDFAIKFDCASTPLKRYVICNGRIVGKKGLYLRSNLMTVNDMTLECSVLGLQTSNCYELGLNNIKVIGNGNTNSIGFDIHCTDSSIMFCTTTNIAKCFIFDNATNYVYTIHGWNTMQIEQSTMLNITADRECIMNNVYCDSIEIGVIADTPKLAINNFIYAFYKSLGGDGKTLRVFSLTDRTNVEIDGGFINYTGDNNDFKLSNKLIIIRNIEDRADVCSFSFTGEEGNIITVNYENGKQFIVFNLRQEIAINLNYIDTFDGLTQIPTNTYIGYSTITETIDGVDYTLKIPVAVNFVKGANKTILYVYHDRKLENVSCRVAL